MDAPRLLYHVSRRVYSPGDLVQITGGINDYSRMIQSEGKDWVEAALERLRPCNRHPRNQVQYAFDDVVGCLSFAEGEDKDRGSGTNSDWHYYEVEMPAPSPHRYELIEWIYRYGEWEEDEEIDALIREYWEPTQPWKRYEYLDRSLRVIRAIEPPDATAKLGLTFRIASDRSLCKQLWPQLLLRAE